jgi:hypothetical protein
MTKLSEIAVLTGTDKLQHGYLPYYEKHLPENPNRLLEIGAFKGASLVLWDTYFKGKTHIHTMDLFLSPENITEEWCNQMGFTPYKGDQSNFEDLDKLPKDAFDIIIEDGSHNSHDQIVSFVYCFLNNLKSGGVWVTEDLHCCTMPYYYSRGIKSFNDTLLCFFQNIDNEEYMNSISESDSSLHLAKSIRHLFASVDLYDDKICFVTKK